jgi:hypothetical protein
MFGRAVTVWVAILILASINGAVRDLLLAPRLGETLARALSTIMLSVVVLLVTWFSIAWIGPCTRRDALLVGLLWVTLTLAFELLAGHYLFHQPWSALLSDYDLRRGRIWILVLIITFVAPLWLGRMRGIVVRH